MLNLSQLDRIKKELEKYPELEKEFLDILKDLRNSISKDRKNMRKISENMELFLRNQGEFSSDMKKTIEDITYHIHNAFIFSLDYAGMINTYEKLRKNILQLSESINENYKLFRNITKGFVGVISRNSKYFAAFIGAVDGMAKVYSRFFQIGFSFSKSVEDFVLLSSRLSMTFSEIIDVLQENFTVTKGIGINELANFITNIRKSQDNLAVYGINAETLSRFVIRYFQTLELLNTENMKITDVSEKRIVELVRQMSKFSTMTNVDMEDLLYSIRKRIEDPFVRIAYRMIPEESARNLDFLSTRFPEVANAIMESLYRGNLAFSQEFDLLLRANLLEVVQQATNQVREGTFESTKFIRILSSKVNEIENISEDLIKRGEIDLGKRLSDLALRLRTVNSTVGNVTQTTKGVIPEMIKIMDSTKAEIIGNAAETFKSMLELVQKEDLNRKAANIIENFNEMTKIVTNFSPSVIENAAKTSFFIVSEAAETIYSIIKKIDVIDALISSGVVAGSIFAIRKFGISSFLEIGATLLRNIENIAIKFMSSIKVPQRLIESSVMNNLFSVLKSTFSIIQTMTRYAISSSLLLSKYVIPSFIGKSARIAGAGIQSTAKAAKAAGSTAFSASKRFLTKTLGAPLAIFLESIGASVEIYDLYNRYQNGEISEEELKKRISIVIGSSIGGIGGATAGATAGSLVFPGIGTLAGAGMGYFAGSSIGEIISEKIYESIATESIKEEISKQALPSNEMSDHVQSILKEAEQMKKIVSSELENMQKELSQTERLLLEKLKTINSSETARSLMPD
jgi:hypothetical protein